MFILQLNAIKLVYKDKKKKGFSRIKPDKNYFFFK